MRRHLHIVFVLLAFAAFPQTDTQSGPRRHQTVWEPPAWNFPQNAKASVPEEMLAKLRVSAYDITLEETSMEDAAKRFGGTGLRTASAQAGADGELCCALSAIATISPNSKCFSISRKAF